MTTLASANRKVEPNAAALAASLPPFPPINTGDDWEAFCKKTAFLRNNQDYLYEDEKKFLEKSDRDLYVEALDAESNTAQFIEKIVREVKSAEKIWQKANKLGAIVDQLTQSERNDQEKVYNYKTNARVSDFITAINDMYTKYKDRL